MLSSNSRPKSLGGIHVVSRLSPEEEKERLRYVGTICRKGRCRTLDNDSQTAWHPGRIC